MTRNATYRAAIAAKNNKFNAVTETVLGVQKLGKKNAQPDIS